MPHILRLRKDGPVSNSGWFPIGTKYTPIDIQNIEDPAGANTGVLLTSIPSPFARMHLFETAFNMVNNTNHNGVRNGIGTIEPTKYHEMVSHCLDMLEIFYDFDKYKKSLQANGFILACHQFHLNDTKNFGVKVDAVAKLENHFTPNIRLLGQTLRTFLKSDGGSINFDYFEYLYIVTINSVPIGGTSPITLFYTVENVQSVMPRGATLNSLDGHTLLGNQIRPLHTRSTEFQKFVHTLFMCHVHNWAINEKMKAMYDYVMNSKDHYISKNTSFFQEISALYSQRSVQAYQMEYMPVKDDGNIITLLSEINQEAITINQKKGLDPSKFESDFMMSSNKNRALVLSSEIDYINWRLTPNFIITNASFKNQVPKGNPGKMSDRTLPIDGTVFPYVTAFDFFEENIIVIEGDNNSSNNLFFEGKQMQPNQNENLLLPIKRAYFDYFDIEDLAENVSIQGQISSSVKVTIQVKTHKGVVTLNKTYDPKNIIKIAKDEPIGIAIYPLLRASDEELNSMYHIATFRDKKVQNDIDLKFYNKNEIVNAQKVQRLDTSIASMYIYKTHQAFDYIALSMGADYKGIIVPKWYKPINNSSEISPRKEIDNGKIFICAIDFGTTNSHIEVQVSGTSTNPIALTHQNLIGKLGIFSKDDLFQDLFFIPNIHTKSIKKISNSVSGFDEGYSFPTRTVTNQKLLTNPSSTDWLSDINIAFFYGQKTNRYCEISTNLKWQIKRDDDTSKNKAEAFIMQMLFMLKNYIIAHNSDPRKAKVIRFFPLSMPEWLLGEYNEIWDNAFNEIFNPVGNDNFLRLSESQAPFYYYETAINDKESVTCVDIGGGTTDVVFFTNQGGQKPKPIHATSFFFGANTLYGTNKSDDDDNIKNPVHIIYESAMAESIKNYIDKYPAQQTLAQMSEELLTKGNSIELINFWLNHDDKTKIINKLKENDRYKFIFLFYYGAIIYHIAQTIKYKGIKCPNYICLSGNGSRFVEILDSDRVGRRPKLTILTKAIMKSVLGESAERIEGVMSAENPKEATCKGGIKYIINKTPIDDIKRSQQMAMLGTNDDRTVEEYTYGAIKANQELKNDIGANVLTFINILEAIDGKRETKFSELFNISFYESDFNWLKLELKKQNNGYINSSLERHSKRDRDYVVEPLFFYPVSGLIFDLGAYLGKVQTTDF